MIVFLYLFMYSLYLKILVIKDIQVNEIYILFYVSLALTMNNY
jgi:hypothetical protein